MQSPFAKTVRRYRGAGVVGVDIWERRARVRPKRRKVVMHALKHLIRKQKSQNVREKERGTYNQNDPARFICSHPARTPPIANPRFVGMRIEPADAGDHPRTAMA